MSSRVLIAALPLLCAAATLSTPSATQLVTISPSDLSKIMHCNELIISAAAGIPRPTAVIEWQSLEFAQATDLCMRINTPAMPSAVSTAYYSWESAVYDLLESSTEAALYRSECASTQGDSAAAVSSRIFQLESYVEMVESCRRAGKLTPWSVTTPTPSASQTSQSPAVSATSAASATATTAAGAGARGPHASLAGAVAAAAVLIGAVAYV